MLGSFLIFLREGIEGSLIITIICTYLAAAGRRDLFRPVFAGVAAALLGSALVGVGLYALAKDAFIESAAQLWFETATFLLAVLVLTYMTFWMKRNSRNLSGSLGVRMATSLQEGSVFALFLLAFVTVGREAIETVIFLLAIAFSTSPQSLVGGAVIGLAVSLSLSAAIYRTGVKLNMRRFFTIVGAALMVVAAGLLANAVQNLQELHILPVWTVPVWSTAGVVSDDSTLGDILHGLLGYAATPTVLQLAVWLLFLVVGLVLFLGRPTRFVAPLGRQRRN